jgi:mycothiol synthase
MTVIFRQGTPADRAALIKLSVLADTAGAEAGSVAIGEGAEAELTGPDPVDASWLAETGSGQVVGYTQVDKVVEADSLNFWLHLVVHPDWRGQGIGRELLQRSWRDMQQARPYQDRPARVNTWAYEQDRASRRLFANFGLAPYHVYHELVIPAERARPVPPLPSGLVIRPWQDQHCELAVSLRNRAFAGSWGYQPATAKALRRCFYTGRYEPDYSFTAWRVRSLSDQDMIGLVHGCLEWTRKLRQANEGEIVWLAVAPEARRQGVGQALLLTAMHALVEAGVETISVGVDNPAGSPPPDIYTGLGFTVRKAIVDYRGEL